MRKLITILTLGIVMNASGLMAEEVKHGENAEHAEAHEGHSGHAGHSSHLSVFAGATTFLELGETAFTAGLDYEYRLPIANRIFGLGVLADFAFGSLETSGIFAAVVGIHPIGGLKILLAPGIEMIFGGELPPEFLLRVSLGYDIMIESISITPIVSLDYVPSTSALSLVYGLSAGIGF